MTVAVTMVLGASLAGCGDDTPPPPDFTGQEVTVWNPCDGLSAPLVSRLFGTSLTMSTGTPAEPECRFSPVDDGGVALNATYSLSPGTLDELLATFGTAKGGTLTLQPRVAGSDGAALIVRPGATTLAVSGFVKNGPLVQAVNVVAPKPYDRGAVVDASTGLLRALSAHADESGLTSASPSDAASGGPSVTPTPTAPGSP